MRVQSLYTKIAQLSIFIFVLCMSSCKKDTCNDPMNPLCKNYEGCNERKSADASFNIYENIGSVAVEADTVWINSPLILWARFRPNTNFAWKIRTNGYSFSTKDSMATIFSNAVFPPLPTAQYYTVTCIASIEVGNCSNLKSVDSTSKVFYMWPKEYIGNWTQINYLPIFGTYAGYKKSNPGQLVYVTIFDSIYTPQNKPCNYQNVGVKQEYNIIRNLAYNNFSSENFTEAYSGTIINKGASGFLLKSNNQVLYNQQPGCYGTKFLVDYSGIATLDFFNNKKINIEYTFWDTVTKLPVTDHFTGLRNN